MLCSRCGLLSRSLSWSYEVYFAFLLLHSVIALFLDLIVGAHIARSNTVGPCRDTTT